MNFKKETEQPMLISKDSAFQSDDLFSNDSYEGVDDTLIRRNGF